MIHAKKKILTCLHSNSYKACINMLRMIQYALDRIMANVWLLVKTSNVLTASNQRQVEKL